MPALFRPQRGGPARAAVLLSGTGSNAEVLLRFSRQSGAHFQVVLLVTDSPLTSRAPELAELFQVPLLSRDLRGYYRAHGEETIRLDTLHRQELRRAWSEELWLQMAPYDLDFALFAGFVPLTPLPEKLPCLNVHPGDLTVEEDGKRIFAGLHYLPVERAILRGMTGLRSSVILTQPFSGSGKNELDSGPVLGISSPVAVDLAGYTLAELEEIRLHRTAPPYHDALRELAGKHIERLKTAGDHVVFPYAADDFASGRFAMTGKQLLFDSVPVRSVEYSADGTRNPVLL